MTSWVFKISRSTLPPLLESNVPNQTVCLTASWMFLSKGYIYVDVTFEREVNEEALL